LADLIVPSNSAYEPRGAGLGAAVPKGQIKPVISKKKCNSIKF
jgi:hypothetical protein